MGEEVSESVREGERVGGREGGREEGKIDRMKWRFGCYAKGTATQSRRRWYLMNFCT